MLSSKEAAAFDVVAFGCIRVLLTRDRQLELSATGPRRPAPRPRVRPFLPQDHAFLLSTLRDYEIAQSLRGVPVVSPEDDRSPAPGTAAYRRLVSAGRALFRWLDGAEGWMQVLLRDAAHPWALEIVTEAEHPSSVVLSEAPWELLHDGARFCVAEGLIAPYRRLRHAMGAPAASGREGASPRLAVVGLQAEPDDGRDMDVEIEDGLLRRASSELGFTLRALSTGALEPLAAELGRRAYDVVHLGAHGSNEPEPGVSLEGSAGEARWCTTDDLSEALLDAQSPALVVLSSCLSGSPSGVRERPSASLAAGLVARGVPAALGFSSGVQCRELVPFFEALYRRLAEGADVPAALRDARACGAGALWYKPRLYLGPTGGGPVARPRPGTGVEAMSAGSAPRAEHAAYLGRPARVRGLLRALGEDGPGVNLYGIGGSGKSALARHLGQVSDAFRVVVLDGGFTPRRLVDRLRLAYPCAALEPWLDGLRRAGGSSASFAACFLRILERLESPEGRQEGLRPLLLVLDGLDGKDAAHTSCVRAFLRGTLGRVTPWSSSSRLLVVSRDRLSGLPLRPVCTGGLHRSESSRIVRLWRGAAQDELQPREQRMIHASMGSPGALALLLTLDELADETSEGRATVDAVLEDLEALQNRQIEPAHPVVRRFLARTGIRHLGARLSPAELDWLRLASLFEFMAVPEEGFQEIARKLDLGDGVRIFETGAMERRLDAKGRSRVALTWIVRRYGAATGLLTIPDDTRRRWCGVAAPVLKRMWHEGALEPTDIVQVADLYLSIEASEPLSDILPFALFELVVAGEVHDFLDWIERCLTLLLAKGHFWSAPQMVPALEIMGRSGKARIAHDFARRILSADRFAGTESFLSWFVCALQTHVQLGEPEAVEAIVPTIRGQVIEHGDPDLIRRILRVEAEMHAALGQTGDAVRLFAEGRYRAETEGDAAFYAACLHGETRARVAIGDTQGVLTAFEESLDLYIAQGDLAGAELVREDVMELLGRLSTEALGPGATWESFLGEGG